MVLINNNFKWIIKNILQRLSKETTLKEHIDYYVTTTEYDLLIF